MNDHNSLLLNKIRLTNEIIHLQAEKNQLLKKKFNEGGKKCMSQILAVDQRISKLTQELKEITAKINL